MAYTSPLGGAVVLNFTVAYTSPLGGAVVLELNQDYFFHPLPVFYRS